MNKIIKAAMTATAVLFSTAAHSETLQNVEDDPILLAMCEGDRDRVKSAESLISVAEEALTRELSNEERNLTEERVSNLKEGITRVKNFQDRTNCFKPD